MSYMPLWLECMSKRLIYISQTFYFFMTNPIFNPKILIVVGLVLFTIMFLWALGSEPAYAGKNTIQNLVGEDGTYKIFEDGVTYKVKSEGNWLYEADDINIIYDGVEYDCVPDGYHSNQFLSPLCVEIIMRSIP